MAVEFYFKKCEKLHAHYIRIFTTSNNTFLKTSLQTSLQNQTKQEGNEKDDFVVNHSEKECNKCLMDNFCLSFKIVV